MIDTISKFRFERYLLILALIMPAISCQKQPEPTPPEEPFTYKLLREPHICTYKQYLNEAAEGYALDHEVLDAIIDALDSLQVIDKDKEVWAYDFEYPSTNLKGEKIYLSARAYLPTEALEGDSLPCVTLAAHHLIMVDKYRPSNNCVVEAFLAWEGQGVIIPDLIGFGSSAQEDQLLTNSNFNGKGNLEGLKAGLMLYDDLGIKYDKEKIYGYGYSQGGQVTMASVRYAALHPELGIKFHKAFAGAGSYDPHLTFKGYNTGNYPDAEIFKVAGLVSIFRELKDKIKEEDVFKEPLLSCYKELFLSKQYDIMQLRDFYDEMGLDTCIQAGVINGTTTAGQLINEESILQRVYCGWEMPEATHFYLYGVKDDDYIPYSNFTQTKYFWEETQPEADITYYDEYTFGHVYGCVTFMIWSQEEW